MDTEYKVTKGKDPSVCLGVVELFELVQEFQKAGFKFNPKSPKELKQFLSRAKEHNLYNRQAVLKSKNAKQIKKAMYQVSAQKMQIFWEKAKDINREIKAYRAINKFPKQYKVGNKLNRTYVQLEGATAHGLYYAETFDLSEIQGITEYLRIGFTHFMKKGQGWVAKLSHDSVRDKIIQHEHDRRFLADNYTEGFDTFKSLVIKALHSYPQGKHLIPLFSTVEAQRILLNSWIMAKEHGATAENWINALFQYQAKQGNLPSIYFFDSEKSIIPAYASYMAEKQGIKQVKKDVHFTKKSTTSKAIGAMLKRRKQ